MTNKYNLCILDRNFRDKDIYISVETELEYDELLRLIIKTRRE